MAGIPNLNFLDMRANVNNLKKKNSKDQVNKSLTKFSFKNMFYKHQQCLHIHGLTEG